MNVKIVLVIVLSAVLAVPAAAQTVAAKVRFGSVYTDLRRSCKVFAGEGGSDGYSICRGPGGYQVRVYYSAAAVHYNAEPANEKVEGNYPIAMLPIGFDDRRTRLEWRTANGKPFAVIMRVPTYAEPRNENEYFGPANGAQLLIQGLKGIDLDDKVDARSPGANEKAREIADAAYLRTLKN